MSGKKLLAPNPWQRTYHLDKKKASAKDASQYLNRLENFDVALKGVQGTYASARTDLVVVDQVFESEGKGLLSHAADSGAHLGQLGFQFLVAPVQVIDPADFRSAFGRQTGQHQ